jgi:UDP-N-acetylmuramoyl-tripeptide--D-alanyl-D-alanine ligase
MSLREVVAATGGRVAASTQLDALLQGVTTDSRRVGPGQLFVPLRGEHFDGHKFLAAAEQAGASALVSDHEVSGLRVPVVVVDNTLRAYQDIARAYRQARSARVLAVTGSNGKTLTKDLLAWLLSRRMRVIKTPDNLNNEIGLPQTLLLMDGRTEAAVVEMGMRGVGQIDELAAIAKPDVGVITTIGEAHLELLGSREAIADAKAELLGHIAANGVAVLPRDNPFFERLRSKARGRVLTFGMHADADIRLLDFQPLGWDGSRVEVKLPSRTLRLRFPLLGRHLADNLLSALAACEALGVDVGSDDLLDGFVPSGQRLEPVTTAAGASVIDDAYNASPTSVRGALALLPQLPCKGRRIAVLGDMLELGPIEQAAHEDVGREAALAGVDVLVAVGPRSKSMAAAFTSETGGHRPVFLAADAQQAAAQVLCLVQRDDVVLVKASHSIGLSAVVTALRTESGTEATETP